MEKLNITSVTFILHVSLYANVHRLLKELNLKNNIQKVLAKIWIWTVKPEPKPKPVPERKPKT